MVRRHHIKIKDGQKYFYRFTPNQRIQHIILALCVIVLVLTGMPLKFHDTFWAPYLYGFFGGIRFAPIVHKIAGVILLILFLYHLGYAGYNFNKNRIAPLKQNNQYSLGRVIKALITHPIVPNLKDARDVLNLLKYYLFLTDRKPEGAEFTWKEKFDYWGPFWGIAVLGPTGLIMWHKEFATQFLPGEVINFALIAHSDEALLAALFLFIWHFYNVHFSTSVFPMETSFLTGYLPEDLMVEEHYEYYREIMRAEGFENEILPPHAVRQSGAEKETEEIAEASTSNQPLPGSGLKRQ